MKRFSLTILALSSLLFLFQQCNTEEDASRPKLTTTNVNDITHLSATAGGEVLSTGGAPVLSRGVCWSTSINPTIENDLTVDGEGVGIFTSSLTGLAGGTTYYVRAYATNKAGTAYGNQVEFTTSLTPTLPIVSTTSVSNITPNSASSGGDVTSAGNAVVTVRGICWSATTGPTIDDNKTIDGTGTGNFVSALTALSAGTTYYVRAYATNSVGTAYGNEVSFSTNSIITTLYAVKDGTIFNTQAGTSPNGNYGAGGSELLQVGYAAPSVMYARTLLQFDLSSIPSNAIIENVDLVFTQGSSGGATSYTIYVHKLTQQWTEGTTSFCTYNNSCNTQGVAIAPGGTDVTWNETSYSGTDSNPWTTPGGTSSASSSASALAGSTTIGTQYTFTSTGLGDDVQSWVSNSSTNFGWTLKTDFITTSSAMKRFYSREGATASGDATKAPKIVITYR